MKMRTGLSLRAGSWLGLAMLVFWSAALFGAVSRTAAPISVHDVLRDENEDFVPDLLGKTVTVKGVLTSKPNDNEKSALVHFQDDTGGLVLFSRDPRAFAQFREGDTVLVRGKVGQNLGMEELEV